MIELLKTSLNFQIFGIAGATIVLIGTLIAALGYRGKDGERYSLLNHFISELGEVGVSHLAWIFNLGLILTGLCLIPASISLGLMLPCFLAKIAMVAGVVFAIGLSFVGVFPMNNLKPHGYAAMTFFRAGLAMVILFSLAIALQSGGSTALSRWFGLAGLPPIIAFSAFLFLIQKASRKTEDPLSTEEVARPRIWCLAILEWLIFVTILFWFILISLGL